MEIRSNNEGFDMMKFGIRWMHVWQPSRNFSLPDYCRLYWDTLSHHSLVMLTHKLWDTLISAWKHSTPKILQYINLQCVLFPLFFLSSSIYHALFSAWKVQILIDSVRNFRLDCLPNILIWLHIQISNFSGPEFDSCHHASKTRLVQVRYIVKSFCARTWTQIRRKILAWTQREVWLRHEALMRKLILGFLGWC